MGSQTLARLHAGETGSGVRVASRKGWAEHSIDLWDVFLSLLNRILKEHRRQGLDELYEISEHVEGARERIEKVVFAEDFVREDDSNTDGSKIGIYKPVKPCGMKSSKGRS